MPRIGAHIHVDNPLAEAIAMGADAVQFFLGDPQGWKAPVIPGGDPEAIKAAYAGADLDIYIHAPYIINVATSNNRIRIPSRKILDQQLQAAASIGAKGLIVHGGHVTAGVDFGEGLENWRKAVERIERPLPMLIENTAGGDGAMARSLDAIGRLWEAVTEAAGDDGENVGFCLDTCHANSAGIALADAVDRFKAITGSTWCTATTHAKSSALAGTGTRTSSRGRSTRRCCSAWSGRRARPPSARRPKKTAGWPPTSAG